MRFLQSLLHAAVILILAFTLRHAGWNWDEGQYLHPDERHLAMVTAALESPDSLAERFNTAESPLNPYNQGVHSYVYGMFPLELVHRVTVARGEHDLREIIRVGRLFSALWSTGTVALLYLLGLRLVSARFASIVALLMACTVLAIQQAHFFTVDSTGVFFTTLCVGLGLIAVREDSPSLLLASAAAVGMAMACRLNLGLLAFWVAAATLSLCWNRKSPLPLLHLAGGGFLALLLFRVLQPYAFAATGWIPSGLNPHWLADLEQVRRISEGSLEVPYTLQWVGKIPYLYALQQVSFWGMGLPLGLLALAGSGVLLWRYRFQPGHWKALLVLWPLLLIGYHGRIFLHTLRYFLPAYPFLILGGALALRSLSSPKVRTYGVRLVMAGTALYALAFVNMYRQPHPRIEASEWLYSQLASGGSVLSEHWDDALPLRLDGFASDHARIQFDQLDVYHPESPDKLLRLIEQIRQADYLVLSSTRASHSLPLLPLRYPVMTRFYAQLDQSNHPLGLRQVARFHRSPGLAGIRLNTLRAEEALRVYDHPLVRIYEKTPDFDPDSLYALLSRDILFERIPDIRYLQAGGNQGWLSSDQLERRRQSPSWTERFSPESIGANSPILIWSIALFLLGPVSFPIVAYAFPNLRDRGASVCRIFGLCLISALAWWPAALEILSFDRSLLLATLLVCGTSALLVGIHTDHFAFLARRIWKRVLWNELLCWSVFAFFLILRLHQPDLWHPWAGGEKPMDFAYLSATAQSSYFPPANPWLSGAFINYYYYGFVLMASLIRMTGIPPDLAYNLALPSCAFFIAGGTLALTRAFFPWFRSRLGWIGWRRGSLLALFLTLFAGNLGQLREYLRPGFPGHPRDVYWNASRVIQVPEGAVSPITEFPYFSLLYGDLHAHLMAVPVAMLCLLAAWQLYRRFHPTRVLLCGFLLGTVWIINAWDLPIQALIFLFACFAGCLHLSRPPLPRFLWSRLGWAALGLLTARLAYAPFHASNTAYPATFNFWNGPRSSLLDLFLAHGLFFIPLVAGGGYLHKHRLLRFAPRRARLLPALLVVGSLITIVLLEFFALEGDAGRMNSVFKFYFQLWWILAPLTALIIIAAFRPGPEPRTWLFPGLCILLLTLSALYPLTATPAKVRDRFWSTPTPTLDGLAYMDQGIWYSPLKEPIALSHDRAGIDWLRRHARPGDVIMEAHRPGYQWGGRMAWHTGLPAVLGWSWHMQQQRPWPDGAREIHQREHDIQRFYHTADPALADRYQVRYIIVGELERITYGPDRFRHNPHYSPVHQTGPLTIYER